ncbi:MAG TPA: cupin domain-containing protein [Dehalococcoidia bacterium]|nr:cupin domain-containing protein [Dehalococcoidia bacterium]
MLERSSIVSSEAELQAYYEDLKGGNLAPLWTTPGGRPEPQSKATPFLWKWDHLRSEAMRALKLVGTKEAERRVLCCVNPALGRGATNTLVANIQVVGPGEIARAHRHTAAALRLIIESTGGYTVVDGEQIPMLPGDLVLTPNWSWHDHANDSTEPMIWLDGLDSPLVSMLEAGFREEYPEEVQKFGEEADLSLAKYGAGSLRPAWESPSTLNSPLRHYPWTQTKAALDRLASTDAGSSYDDVIMEYTNPVTGGPVMPTIGCYVQLLRPGKRTASHRHTGSTVYHVIEGQGSTLVDGVRLDWGSKDVFTIPGWATHEHANESTTHPAYLFSYTDAPVFRALGLYREEATVRH